MDRSTELKAFMRSAPPRQGELVSQLARSASKLHRITLYVALGLAVALGLIIIVGADPTDRLKTLPAALMVVLIFAVPFYIWAKRAQRSVRLIAASGASCAAEVLGSRVITVRGQPMNLIEVSYQSPDDRLFKATVVLPGREPVHERGDEVVVLSHIDRPRITLAYSEQFGVKPARALAAEQATVKKRAMRIAIGLGVGLLALALFFWLFATA